MHELRGYNYFFHSRFFRLTDIPARSIQQTSQQLGAEIMKTFNLLAATMLAVATPVMAQDITSASGSGAEANSGSVSGAQSNGNEQAQGQSQYNAGIGSSASNSESGSVALSGSESTSGSVSDQGQAQYQGQTASNQQGVNVSNTFNSTNHKRSYVGTNAAVPLAASTSFSSDYCGGTASGGAAFVPT